MFGIKLIANYVTRRRNKAQREILKAREAAVLVSTGVFLDTSVYFAFSNLLRCHNLFNYRDKPLLYEDSTFLRSLTLLFRCKFLNLASCQRIICHGDMFQDSKSPEGEPTLTLNVRLELGQASTLLTINPLVAICFYRTLALTRGILQVSRCGCSTHDRCNPVSVPESAKFQRRRRFGQQSVFGLGLVCGNGF